MNNVSFKATLVGMDAPVVQSIFKFKTQNDTKHKIVYIKNDDKYGEDIFELYKNGKKTAEYKTDLISEDLFSIKRLMGIFNILKTKEAQAQIDKMKKNNHE